jgi:hypothetical protein
MLTKEFTGASVLGYSLSGNEMFEDTKRQAETINRSRQVGSWSDRTSATWGGALPFTPGFIGVRVARFVGF